MARSLSRGDSAGELMRPGAAEPKGGTGFRGQDSGDAANPSDSDGSSSARPATVGSVDHALDVLEAVARGGRGVGVTEIGRLTNLPKSTVFRLLAALAARGYIVRGDPPSSYRLGVKAWEVGAAYLNNLSFHEAAHPIMQRLAGETGETIYLTTYADGAAVLIDVAESPDPVRWSVAIGTRLPAWCTAVGKVLLAHQPAEEVDRVLTGPLAPPSPHAPSDPAGIRREIEEARLTDCSVNLRGWHAEVAGAAVPIRDRQGRVIAALGVAGPAERFVDKLDRVRVLMEQGARAISEQIGHRV